MEKSSDAPAPVRVLAFAAVRDVIGVSEVALPVAGSCTAEELWPLLVERFPALAPYQRAVRMAVNGTYAQAGDVVRPGDEVALIPPVAGG